MSGPLTGLKVVEVVGLGAAPFGAMMLADMGADVIRLERPEGTLITQMMGSRCDAMARNRRSVAINLKHPEGVEAALELIEVADVVLEGFRPGVMERLGLGPRECLQRNPGLVYGRMTGWGQDGPLSMAAGHDINYIATAGVLNTIGPRGGKPQSPWNLLGDFGGGGMLLALGVLGALYHAKQSGKGQVVDAAMAEGAALLHTMNWGARASGIVNEERGSNINDGGCPYYNSYACADGKYVCIAPEEPQFYAELRRVLELNDPIWDDRDNRANWPEFERRFTKIFASRTRQEWCDLLEGGNACFAPVLDWDDAVTHPHNKFRGMFVEIDGVTQPAPAPRFQETPASEPTPPPAPGAHTREVLGDWGFPGERVQALLATGAVTQTG